MTFNIIEAPDGEFVLSLRNRDPKLLSEEFRSKSIDELVEELKIKIDYRRHFMNALSNYAPVLANIDDLDADYPEAVKEEYPEDWTDPFEICGAYASKLYDPGIEAQTKQMAQSLCRDEILILDEDGNLGFK